MKATRETFIEKAIKIHENKYNYDKVEYINSATKVCITCPRHGDFWQTPSNYLAGYGCPECKKETIGNLKRKTKEQFIAEAIAKHGNKYDYSQVEYKNTDTKVDVICPTHGVFHIRPNDHLRGVGCRKCYGNETKTTEEFIQSSKKIFGDLYR